MLLFSVMTSGRHCSLCFSEFCDGLCFSAFLFVCKWAEGEIVAQPFKNLFFHLNDYNRLSYTMKKKLNLAIKKKINTWDQCFHVWKVLMKDHYFKYQYTSRLICQTVPSLPGLHCQHTLFCGGRLTITDATPLHPVIHSYSSPAGPASFISPSSQHTLDQASELAEEPGTCIKTQW